MAPLAFQADQLPFSDNTDLATNDIALAISDPGTGVSLYSFASEASIPAPKAGFPVVVTNMLPSRPLGIVSTLGGVHVFWLFGSPFVLYHAKVKGTSVSAATPVISSTNSTYGVSACRIHDPSEGLLGIAVVLGSASTATQAQVLICQESDLSVIASVTIDTGNIKSPCVGITQNPRTKIITLAYISDTIATVRNFEYSSNVLTPAATNPSIGNTWANAADSIKGFSNFETSFAGNNSGETLLRDASLHFSDASMNSGYSIVNTTFGSPGLMSLFSYNRSEELNAGLIVQSKTDPTSFQFWRRPLVYPAACGWDPVKQVLHLEGPPFPGTKVTVTAFFPEPATSTCVASAVNALGGALPFDQPALRLIASAGAMITLAFTGDMMTASASAWLGNTYGKKIRLFGPAQTPLDTSIDIVPVSAGLRSLTFKLNEDLAPDTAYRIQIASDVL
ncbi:MAG TPA: hypothetical protein PKM25_03315, partial [Candidatus Ozemobacteraceae bacterium]|nr:hypothetical protein [Candidatus Ozemobacteraceae bacterium]